MRSIAGQYGSLRARVQWGGRSRLRWRGARAALARLFGALALGLMLTPAWAEAPLTLALFGDSLTAGYGLPASEALPARLHAALARAGFDVRIINAGVSGDTASGGRDRLDWSLPDPVDAVVVELGANDALRGLDPDTTEAALDAIIARLKARGIAVLLCGMRAPPNMGADYARRFDAIYPALAAKHGVALYPFFLDGVAAKPALNQKDGIHPNGAGVDVIVARLLPAIVDLIKNARGARR